LTIREPAVFDEFLTADLVLILVEELGLEEVVEIKLYVVFLC